MAAIYRSDRLDVARSQDPDAGRIYELHRRWLLEVLPNDDSLLTPGQPIWTLQHLAELERDFVKSPDETPGKAYLDKLRDQLASSSDGARQLMAELHVVHFWGVTTRSIAKDTKLATVRAILSWTAVPPEIPDDVAAAMAPGLYHPGQWALTRRDTQITWLIEFSRRHKLEPTPPPVDDPWSLRAFAESIVAPSADAARLALLHQTFPDTFEQTVSVRHKELMAKRFSRLASNDDLDRQLLEIRKALSVEYGERFNFYAPPLELMWWHGRAWTTFMRWLQRFRELPTFDDEERTYKLQLAGRLGDVAAALRGGDAEWVTMLHAALKDPLNNLTGWRVHTPFLDWVDSDLPAATSALQAIWGSGSPIERLQKFLGVLPPALLPQPGQRIILATFLLTAEDPTGSPPVKVRLFRTAWKLADFAEADGDPAAFYERAVLFLDELVHADEGWATPLRDRLDAQGAVWSLVRWDRDKHGLPSGWSATDWEAFESWRSSGGTAEPEDDDTTAVLEEEVADEATTTDDEPSIDHVAVAARACYVDRAVLDEIVRLLEDKKQVVLYGPPGTGKTFIALRLARAIAQLDDTSVSLVQFHPATTYEDFFEGLRPSVTGAGQVTYELTSGPLVDIVDRAMAEPDRTFVMVIDEINRANLPKVFGELLFMLEYRGEPVRTLYRTAVPFRLPANLWFIATMNTADRSVALVDAALRRRFHFVPFFPHEGAVQPVLRNWLTQHGLPVRLADFLDAVNNDLVDQLGDHLLIGPSYFMRSDLSEPALAQIWTYNVFPLLEEHLWGQRDEIQRWRWPEVQQRYASQLTGKAALDPSAPSDPPPNGADEPDDHA